MSKHSEEQIITRAMGVRVPPRVPEKVSTDKSMPIRLDHAPSPPIATLPSTPSLDPTKSNEAQTSELSPGEGKPLESIKITAPGTYELNLPSLFERDELIMAVKEGTYFIDLTSAFKKGKKD
jgi:predicted  nucleic acid-binding Zn-ribbon protein